MKRILTTLSLALLTLGALAIPAKKGIWQTLPLNGTMVKAQLVGDEHLHYWLADDGRQLTEADGTFVVADMPRLVSHAQQRRANAASRRRSQQRRGAVGEFTHYTGQKKGLIILVEFANMQFMPQNDSLLYTRICNEEGFSEGRFSGSVYDYFKAQSYGEFELTFDVVGPVQMPNNYQYYGSNDSEGNDMRPGEMVVTACQAIDPLVNFGDYDWDGDGIADQVMCIYAGPGEASGGSPTTIWPHEWQLDESDHGETLTLDGVVINTYAVANERVGNRIDGLGTICHEFSHCLGLPDMYDVFYGGNFGMGEWSLMDRGSYNGDGFCPAGYTSFERYSSGWVKPQVLTDNQTISAMLPLSDAPEVYMLRNDAYDDEYYLLENRQQKGWDAMLPGNGLLVLHVDFDRDIWEYNLVNTTKRMDDYPLQNDHQRCTIIHANYRPNANYGTGTAGDPFPYERNDSLTNTSVPAATLWNPNADGRKLLNKAILDIARGKDDTMSFRFRNSAEEVYLPEGTLFYESFNGCAGKGGNDGQWTTTMASSVFMADNAGWQAEKAYGGYQCARFGNAIRQGTVSSPRISMPTGKAMLTFKAAGWPDDGDTLRLSVVGEGTVTPSLLTLQTFAWSEYSVIVKGQGELSIQFTPAKRFLLDNVLVQQLAADDPSGISTATPTTTATPAYYTLDGRLAGHDLQQLPRGIYLLRDATHRQGRKVVKKQ